MTAQLVAISFSMRRGEAFYLPVPRETEKIAEFLKPFKKLFEESPAEKIGHNVKYDILVLRKYDIRVGQPYFDTMLAHYILEPDMRRRSMDVLAELYLGYTPVPIEQLLGKKGKNQKTMLDLEDRAICNYACEDADITLQLRHHFAPIVAETGNDKLMAEIELPLIEVLADMEEKGIQLDVESLNSLSQSLETDILKIKTDIYKSAGSEFNIASPRQVGEVLFDHLKIDEKAKKTKTGQYATGEEILSKLSDKHPIINQILDFRELVKLKNTYVDVLPTMVHEKDGRIHTTFNQVVAATGRLSSDHPNLQNVPVKTKRGQEVRKAFVPKNEDCILMASDYSQVELRILASMSDDQGMIEAFQNGEDIHASTAAKVFGVSKEEVDREMRTKAKAVNFGIAYGQGAFGLSQNLNIPRKEAKEIIDNYFEKFAGIRTYMQEVVEKAQELGYVETIMGRRRLLRNINSANAVVRGQSERLAINAPIQGSAADIIKIAMINIQAEMKKRELKSQLLLQVHDELVFDAHRSEVDELKVLVEERMSGAVQLKVPLLVDTGLGENWLEAH